MSTLFTINNLKRTDCQEQEIVSIYLHRFIMDPMSCCTDGHRPGLIYNAGVGVSVGVGVGLQSVNELTCQNLTFRGPCIVIYSYNKTNEMH